MSVFNRFLADRDGKPRFDLALLLIVLSVPFFLLLGRLPLIEPDEGRYAEIPREMLLRGDFITPCLNYVKYFEKPPLHYWLNAISMSLFGENEFAARFPGTLLGLATVLLTYHVGRRLFDRRTGLFAALVLGTSAGFLVQARLNFTDMTLTFCLSAALGCFALASREEEPRQGFYYYLFYVFAALAVLAKGLIGIVLPGGIIFVYLLCSRRWQLLRLMRLASGIPLFLLVAAPWFILVSLHNPEFARFFFIHEHFERFLTKVHGRYQPFWFFVPVLIGCLFPWSFFLPAAVTGIWRQRASRVGDSRLYLFIWAIIIFLFFSKSNSKLIPYILPVFPAVALLLGKAFADLMEAPPRLLRILATVVAGVLLAAGAGMTLYPHLAARPAVTATTGAIIGILFFAEGAAALLSLRRSDVARFFAVLCLFSYLTGIAGILLVMPGVAEKKNTKGFGLIIRQLAPPEAVVATFGFEQGLSFYAQRRIMVIGDRGELEFGSKQ
ncbi:MAG TPA: glycosyltransferase family 39 protein, partial [Geobacteraceae bacterium]